MFLSLCANVLIYPILQNYCCPDVAIFSGWSSQWPAVREQMEEMVSALTDHKILFKFQFISSFMDPQLRFFETQW